MSRTASLPSVRSCRSSWNASIGGNPIHGSLGSTLALEVDNVVMRRPTLDDAGGIAALLAARDRADFGERPSRVHRRLVERVVGNGRARACDRRVDCSQRR